VDKCRKNAFKTYLFPFLVLTVFMYGIRYLIYGHATLQFQYPTLALWFLLVMFFYRLFVKDLVKIRYMLPISFAISILAGLIPFLGSQFALGRTFGFLPFFMLGYYFNAEKVSKIQKLPKWSTILLLIVLLTYSGMMAYTRALPLSIWFFKSSYAFLGLSNITGMMIRSGLIVAALGWIVVFLNLVPDKKTWYSDIGLYTMSVYALHLTFRHVITKAGTDFGGGILSFIIPMLLVAVTVWVLSRPAVSDKYNFVMDSLYHIVMIPYRKIAEKIEKKS
jgi:fucose 4-O-acetylase-like acetyltransferase